jgi:hypothetical protein
MSPQDISALVQVIILLISSITAFINWRIHEKIANLPTKQDAAVIANTLANTTASSAATLANTQK